MAAPAGTNRRAAVRESGPRVRPIIAKGDTDDEKLAGKGGWDGQAGRAGAGAEEQAGGERGEVEGARARAGSQGAGGQSFPYSMPTTVARSGTVTRARAVVMNVPCAIVFASPWYW